MAPSPEYDKEPKAPDKSATNISSEDTNLLHNLINDQHHNNSDHKTTNSATNSEVENNKHVETLDDDKLRALLNEALTYKCPKDREGKSSLFKELLEEVEQDEAEACSAAVPAWRGARRGARGRPALPHSNSLQDLVAALAAEPAPRRHRHHAPAPQPATVAARALHGGSLPSGVDTSSLLSEEGGARAGGAGYLATVRCVNPPPLAERRVSASDANAPHELETLNRRSKPMFPMTYTARATLEIGSGSVCSGRAVTTTTASNQVRTSPHPPAARALPAPPRARSPARGPPERHLKRLYEPESGDLAQKRLMSAICAKINDDGGGAAEPGAAPQGKGPRGPAEETGGRRRTGRGLRAPTGTPKPEENDLASQKFLHNVGVWYEGLAAYSRPLQKNMHHHSYPNVNNIRNIGLGDDVNSKKVPPKARDDVASCEDRIAAPFLATVAHKSFEECYSVKYSKESMYTNNFGQRQSDKIAHRVEHSKFSGSSKSDISLRKTYRERIVPKTLPTLPSINPRNIRSMSIGNPQPSFKPVDSQIVAKDATRDKVAHKNPKATADEVTSDPIIESGVKGISCNDIKTNDTRIDIESEISESMEDQTSKCFQMSAMSTPPADSATGGTDANALNPSSDNNDIELEEIVCHSATKDNRDTGSFSHYLADQEKLFQVLQATHLKTNEDEYSKNVLEHNNNIKSSERSDDVEPVRKSPNDVSSENDINMSTNIENDAITCEPKSCDDTTGAIASNEVVVQLNRKAAGDRYILAELPNNAYIFLTLPKRLLTPLNRDYRPSAEVTEIESSDRTKQLPETKPKRKKDKLPVGTSSSTKKKETINKNALRVLLFENLLKSDRGEPTGRVSSAVADKEVDSAIPFSCITTPEVVASCNTTSSASHAAVAVDPKPLQLGRESECGAAATLAAASAASAAPSARPDTADEQPRSVVASSFNGLPLSRPNYGATATTSSEEYKKSLDENGNSVQGYSSPLSGSSQHKKPRRKKSSKNETVIDCRQIDGYQGDKDVNELLRFIESNAEHRAPKLRAKHKDDADDKGKKRSAERRKDKEHGHKPARASSLEELSRTTLEELTAAPPAAAPPAAEPEPASAAAAAVPEHDFQTVTKKRKPRRRTEEAAPRRARAPSPRRQDSAPPSDRSNDSNDDMESVHSLPAPAAPPPHASYADIARTRHNIPDLIESCNFYAEGEGGAEPRRRAEPPPVAPPDADGYPALERADPAPAAAARRPPPPARRDRKERAAAGGAPAPAPDCPAPDVVSDRRPPVILLDSASRPRDMDGVTFGFDINEQLLGGGARRPRCDLVRDALEAAPAAAAAAAVPVRAAKRALRYVPPPPPSPPAADHLLRIVDFVGGAWDDVVRCGSGKVRYFSE